MGLGTRATHFCGLHSYTHSLYNSLLLTHQQEWGTAHPRLAESPGTGRAFPWDSESMPGGPRADQSPSTVGGHRLAVKGIRTRAEETEMVTCTGRPERPWRGYGSAGEGPSAPLTLLRSGGFPKLSSAPSWTERNSARRTRASSRETSVGRPSAPPSGPPSDSEQPGRPGSGKARLAAHVSEARPPGGTCWVPPSQRGHGHPFLSRTAGFPSGPGDAALPAHRQHLPTRPVSSVHSSAVGWSGRRRPPRLQPALWGGKSGTSED